MSATLRIDVGVNMSKAIVREKFKDFFKGRLSIEEQAEIKDAYSALYGILVDYDVFSISYLIKYSQGYTIPELCEMYGTTEADIQKTLKYTYALFGELLSLDDEMLLRRVEKPVRVAATAVLERIYSEFLEIE